MRNYIKLIAAALLLCSCYAFKYKNITEPPTGVAYYHFFHIRDTTNTGTLWEEDFLMPFNAYQSFYTSSTKMTQDSIQMAKIEAAMKTGSSTVNMGTLLRTTSDNIYLNEKESTLYINKNFNRNNYLIKEALEKINWKIEQETIEILGYTCQKATGKCKGRQYTAWFTTDIPASLGPWKLHGLPGLILEAYDASQRIKFTCTKVVTSGKIPASVSLELPSDATATTTSAYNQMEKASKNGFGMDVMNSSGLTIDNVVVDKNGPGTTRKKFTVNFPLELTK
ncbi:GLPGLI family protein [Pedobacter sp. ok626]|uniref:GLPGLI family protein n=1 Tax=Pedobacter sp. ok626 TaxID=1761882 RepID=UPI00087E6FF2|nr:GLPGLI family protein [Pedobacter sp. ok626]SDL64376.1 GLPGLI family protein [Pedobacter sp. ok626]